MGGEPGARGGGGCGQRSEPKNYFSKFLEIGSMADLTGKDRLLMVLAHRDYIYATSEMTADRIKAAFDEYLKDNPYV